jgi:hypothetical protein
MSFVEAVDGTRILAAELDARRQVVDGRLVELDNVELTGALHATSGVSWMPAQASKSTHLPCRLTQFARLRSNWPVALASVILADHTISCAC